MSILYYTIRRRFASRMSIHSIIARENKKISRTSNVSITTEAPPPPLRALNKKRCPENKALA